MASSNSKPSLAPFTEYEGLSVTDINLLLAEAVSASEKQSQQANASASSAKSDSASSHSKSESSHHRTKGSPAVEQAKNAAMMDLSRGVDYFAALQKCSIAGVKELAQDFVACLKKGDDSGNGQHLKTILRQILLLVHHDKNESEEAKLPCAAALRFQEVFGLAGNRSASPIITYYQTFYSAELRQLIERQRKKTQLRDAINLLRTVPRFKGEYSISSDLMHFLLASSDPVQEARWIIEADETVRTQNLGDQSYLFNLLNWREISPKDLVDTVNILGGTVRKIGEYKIDTATRDFIQKQICLFGGALSYKKGAHSSLCAEVLSTYEALKKLNYDNDREIWDYIFKHRDGYKSSISIARDAVVAIKSAKIDSRIRLIKEMMLAERWVGSPVLDPELAKEACEADKALKDVKLADDKLVNDLVFGDGKHFLVRANIVKQLIPLFRSFHISDVDSYEIVTVFYSIRVSVPEYHDQKILMRNIEPCYLFVKEMLERFQADPFVLQLIQKTIKCAWNPGILELQKKAFELGEWYIFFKKLGMEKYDYLCGENGMLTNTNGTLNRESITSAHEILAKHELLEHETVKKMVFRPPNCDDALYVATHIVSCQEMLVDEKISKLEHGYFFDLLAKNRLFDSIKRAQEVLAALREDEEIVLGKESVKALLEFAMTKYWEMRQASFVPGLKALIKEMKSSIKQAECSRDEKLALVEMVVVAKIKGCALQPDLCIKLFSVIRDFINQFEKVIFPPSSDANAVQLFKQKNTHQPLVLRKFCQWHSESKDPLSETTRFISRLVVDRCLMMQKQGRSLQSVKKLLGQYGIDVSKITNHMDEKDCEALHQGLMDVVTKRITPDAKQYRY